MAAVKKFHAEKETDHEKCGRPVADVRFEDGEMAQSGEHAAPTGRRFACAEAKKRESHVGKNELGQNEKRLCPKQAAELRQNVVTEKV